MGLIQIGFNNTRVPVKFEKKFSEEIKDYLDIVFPKKDGSLPVTIRVNELLVVEDPKDFTEEGITKLVLDVIKPSGNNLFQLLGRYNIISEKTTFDATRSHPLRIQTALKESLLNFKRDNPNFDSRGILNLQNEPNGLPILKENIETGYHYFYTFFELQNNRPIVDTTIKILSADDWSKTEKVILKDVNNETPNYAAFHDGHNFYINANLYSDDDYFVKTYKIDNFLLFNEMFLKNVSYVNDLALTIGKTRLPYMQDRNCFILDLTTGIFHGITLEKMKILLDENYPDLYKIYRRYGQKDMHKVQEILNQLFKKEPAEKIRSILAPILNSPHTP